MAILLSYLLFCVKSLSYLMLSSYSLLNCMVAAANLPSFLFNSRVVSTNSPFLNRYSLCVWHAPMLCATTFFLFSTHLGLGCALPYLFHSLCLEKFRFYVLTIETCASQPKKNDKNSQAWVWPGSPRDPSPFGYSSLFSPSFSMVE